MGLILASLSAQEWRAIAVALGLSSVVYGLIDPRGRWLALAGGALLAASGLL